MISLYGNGFSTADKQDYLKTIRSNCILWIQEILKASDYLFKNFNLATVVSSELFSERNLLENLRSPFVMNRSISMAIKKIWETPEIQLTWEHRSKFQIQDSAAYFFNKIDRISESSFEPDLEDILRCRIKTIGIVETNFSLMGSKFRLYDVAGQRSERKKWIHCFENVTGVIFVAAISEYDQVCAEDESTNRVSESVELFGQISNSKWLQRSAMILFLNKEDLLREKLKKVPLSEKDNRYKGDNSFESAVKYFSDLFLQQSKDARKRIYVHVTCATNSDNVNFVFSSVKNILLQNSLMDGGLM